MAAETTLPSPSSDRPVRFVDFMKSLYQSEIGLVDQYGPGAFSKSEWANWLIVRPLLFAESADWESLALDKVSRHRLKTRIGNLLDELDIDKQQLRLEAFLAREDFDTDYLTILQQVRQWVPRALSLRDPRTLQAIIWKLRVSIMNHAEVTLQREVMQLALELAHKLEPLVEAETVLYNFWLNPWEADLATPENLLSDPRLSAGTRFELGRMLMLHYHPRRMLPQAMRVAQWLYDGICKGDFYSSGNQTRVVKYLEFIRFELFEDATPLVRDLLKDTTGQLLHYRLNQVLRSLSLRRFEGVAEALADMETEAHASEELHVMHKLIRTEFYILTGNLQAAENLNEILFLDKGNLFFKSTGDKLINHRLRIFLLRRRFEEVVALYHRKATQKMIEPMLRANRYYYVPTFCEQIAQCQLTPSQQPQILESMLNKLEGFLPEVNFHCYKAIQEAAELIQKSLELPSAPAEQLQHILATVRAKMEAVQLFSVTDLK